MYYVREFEACFFMYVPFFKCGRYITAIDIRRFHAGYLAFQKNLSGCILVCGFEKYVISTSLAD